MDDTWRSRERAAIAAAARIIPRQRLSISMDDRRRGEVCSAPKPSRIPFPRERSGSTPVNRSLLIDKGSTSSGKDSRLSMSTSDSDSRQSSSTRLSRISLTFSSIGDVQCCSTLSNSSEILNGDKIHSDYSITLSLTTLFEHIKLVTVMEKTWVAGWSRNMEKVMPGTLHVGDQIVNDREIETGVHSYIYGNAIPGAPMRVTIRKQPHAITYTLVKPIHPSKWNLGIALHHGKNRIESIEEDSIAYRRGVPAELPSLRDPSKMTPSAITDVNGKRLGLWSRNDELFRMLEGVRDGLEFTLTLQPHDFVKAVKLAMKAQTKLYKAYC
ncbi:hypothetical protein PENTCL1PPCAC_29634 [Pristionchus entomophagus]|uniref:Uncharacterized protein n=1 Tax=Pristionchus entomophagus TaxID=358040 RepID=A0AAV5UK61_9BILA|nr:hypothetical protein PENTCL1PPCAC_29634 [Pristionchus entomophagus]